MNLQKKLANLLATTKRRRPYYCEVEYLESTGTQYIDTGVIGKDGITAETRIQRTTTSSNECFVGAFNLVNRVWLVYTFGNNWYCGYNAASGSWTPSTPITDWYTIKSSIPSTGTVVFDCNGASKSSSYTTGFTTGVNVQLFQMGNTTTDHYPARGKMSYCKLYDYGVLVHDFIPVLDWDMTPCMYDKVSGELFYNQGTGEFLYGRQIHSVEYLESTGTQYIDTGYAFTDNFSWEIDFEGISDGKTLFGGRTSSIRTALLYQRNDDGIDKTTCPIAGYNGKETPFQFTDLRLGRHKIKMSVASNKGSVWVDGTQVYNEQAFTGTYISGTTQVLFADNFGSSVSEHTSSKVYGLKMWQGSNPVRDFIPGIDENGVGFMFDRVTHTIYDNAGNADGFKYPPVELEYLESTGTQYIDTGIAPLNIAPIAKMKFIPTQELKDNGIFGCYGANNTRFQIYFNSIGIGTYVTKYWQANTTYEVELNGKVPSATINGNVETSGYSNTNGFSSDNMYLFTRNNRNVADSGAQLKLYYCRIWDNDILVRNFIPVFKDGSAGMWDKVNKIFYENKGTGNFIAGLIREK